MSRINCIPYARRPFATVGRRSFVPTPYYPVQGSYASDGYPCPRRAQAFVIIAPRRVFQSLPSVMISRRSGPDAQRILRCAGKRKGSLQCFGTPATNKLLHPSGSRTDHNEYDSFLGFKSFFKKLHETFEKRSGGPASICHNAVMPRPIAQKPVPDARIRSGFLVRGTGQVRKPQALCQPSR